MASHTINGSGITVKTAPHGANKLGSGHTQTHFQPVTNAAALFQGSGQKSKSLKWKRIIQSSFQQQLTQPQLAPLYASSNGFVKGAIDAYNQHHHFVIRPEDVWFAILTQFSCYVNAHAEELRSKFVAHEGKEELEIVMALSDFGFFAEEMSKLLEKNVVDPELREWILPAFSTTTRDDGVVASILMMGTLQKYFSYTAYFSCGLPSVTLLGTEGDWENILLRLEKLKNYGDEPTIWYSLLKPVLTRFVQTFQSPDSEEVLDFWQRIAQQSRMGSGPPYLSGWITAFCFWDEEGHLLYRGPESASRRYKQSNPNSFRRRLGLGAQSPSTTDSQKEWNATGSPPFVLDGAEYHSVKIDMVPSGHGSLPVHVDDNGHEFDTTMIAGSVGIMGTSSGKPLQNGEVGLDTLQPVSGWWIFENGE